MATDTRRSESTTDVPAGVPTDDAAALPAVPAAVESAEGKLVYLALATAGETAVDDLAATLSLSRATLYGVLDALASRDVVERLDDGRFAAVRPGSASGSLPGGAV